MNETYRVYSEGEFVVIAFGDHELMLNCAEAQDFIDIVKAISEFIEERYYD